jgi:hypothetical protein
MIREVWAEFGDGSVAKYGVEDNDLPDLLMLLRNSGVSCTLWIDGRIRHTGDPIDISGSNDQSPEEG